MTTTRRPRTKLDIVCASLALLGGLILPIAAVGRLSAGRSLIPFAVTILQGFVLLASALAILKRHRSAVALVWTSTILFAVAVLAQGIVPKDLFVWLLILAYAIGYTKRSKITPEQAKDGQQASSMGTPN
jgi:hypothetical protein